jgi:transcription elongation factor Elf1
MQMGKGSTKTQSTAMTPHPDTDITEHLPHQTFPAECPICGHRMQIVCLVGTKVVPCSNCGKEIEVPKTFKEN